MNKINLKQINWNKVIIVTADTVLHIFGLFFTALGIVLSLSLKIVTAALFIITYFFEFIHFFMRGMLKILFICFIFSKLDD